MSNHDTHTMTGAPAISGVLDLDGTEPQPDGAYAPAGSIRGFRAGSRGHQAPTDVPAVDDTKGERANAHSGRGSADGRRGWFSALTALDREPIPVAYADNSRQAVVITPEAPPARPRLGWTGEDNTRAATFRRPNLMRGFDKLIAEHPATVLKVEQDAPTAARPKDHLADVGSSQPFAGGSTGTQAAGIGPGRNTFRIMPKAWDALLVETGGPAVSDTNPDPAWSASASQAARSFRSR